MASVLVMVVEDEIIVSKGIRMSIRNLGYDTCCAVTTGEKAVEKAHELMPDLILMDIALGGKMDGIEAARQIRSALTIPIIFLTAYADDEKLERAKEAEPFGYLIKPFEDRELKAAIETGLYKAKIEAKLREREEWLSTTLSSIGDAVISTDMNGRVSYINPVAQSLTGWSEEEALGRPLDEVFRILNEESREELDNPASRVIREGRVVGLANHTVLIAKDGREIPIDDSGAPVRSHKGEMTGVVLVFRDVTDRKFAEKRLLDSHMRISSILESITDGFFSLDDDLVMNYINEAAIRMLGRKREDVLGRKLFDAFPEARGSVFEEQYTRALRKRIPLSFETCFEVEPYANWYEVRVFPHENEGISVFFQTSTERKRAEQQLRESESRYRTLVDNLPQRVFLKDRSSVYVSCNTSFARDLRIEPLEIAGKTDYDFHPVEIADKYRTDDERIMRSGETEEIEEQYILNGRTLLVSTVKTPVRDDLGNTTGVLGIFRDITDRRLSEEALRRSRKDWEQIFQAIGHPTLILDSEHNIKMANRAALKAITSAEKDIAGKKCYELFHGGNHTPQECPMKKMLVSGHLETIEMEMEALGGVFLVSCTPVLDDKGELQSIIHIATDISDRKRAEKKLQESEEHYKNIFESSPVGIFQSTVEGKYLAANSSLARIYGYDSPEELMRDVNDSGIEEKLYLNPYERARIIEEVQSSQGWRRYQRPYYRRDGSMMVSNLYIRALRDRIGSVTHLEGMVEDITERIRAEGALKESEKRYRQLAEQSLQGIAILKSKPPVYVFVNPRWTEIFGYSIDEALSFGPDQAWNLVHPDDRTSVRRRHYDRLEGKMVPAHYEHRVIRKDGIVCWVEVFANIIEYGAESSTQIVYVDITDRKRSEEERARLEKELRQAQKMEAIGTLAGGIAHDFNNILAAILGYTELTMLKLPKGPEYGNLDQVVRAAFRAKELVSQILLFSRRASQEKKPVNLGIIAKEALQLLRASLPTTIDIRRNISPTDQYLVSADPTQIHQVLVNLCTNAAHSMRERGGTLAVSLSEVDIDDGEEARHPELEPGPYVKLSVSDTGQGMEPSILERIFDPFFTTKESGEGTGLGLSVVHGIIKHHDAAITVQSKPGAGTTFHIYFPRLRGEVGYAPRVSSEPLKGNGRILFVDDEQVLVDMTKRMLGTIGYSVAAMTNPVEALELFRSDPQQFDLVITDLTMPHMTGLDLAEKILSTSPRTPVILCTGYSEMITEEKAASLGIRKLVLKPISLAGIADAVAGALKEKTAL